MAEFGRYLFDGQGPTMLLSSSSHRHSDEVRKSHCSAGLPEVIDQAWLTTVLTRYLSRRSNASRDHISRGQRTSVDVLRESKLLPSWSGPKSYSVRLTLILKVKTRRPTLGHGINCFVHFSLPKTTSLLCPTSKSRVAERVPYTIEI